jgi:hypothetical protein
VLITAATNHPSEEDASMDMKHVAKIKAANSVARILEADGIPWLSCYPANHVNNALGEEGVYGGWVGD